MTKCVYPFLFVCLFVCLALLATNFLSCQKSWRRLRAAQLNSSGAVADRCSGSASHPPALPQCSISRPSQCDRRAGTAAFPSYVSSVQADDACFISRISGDEVMSAVVALKSRVGLKRLVLNLEWAAWSCLMGMSAMGQHC